MLVLLSIYILGILITTIVIFIILILALIFPNIAESTFLKDLLDDD